MRTVTKCKSGLRIVTDTMPEIETISLGAWVNIGSMYEPKEINGISHLLEHMVFKGTKKRTAKQIAEEIENVGGYFNAATSRETTAFYIKVLKEDLNLAVDILSDILLNSTFEPSEFNREKSVVLQEISQSVDTPDDIIFDYFQECAYPEQPCGRPILGNIEIVQAISRETLHDYLKNNYTPDRMVISASGNLNHDVFVDLIQKAFSKLEHAKGLIALDARYVGGEKRIIKDIEQVNMVLGFPGVTIYDDNYFTSNILSTILGGGMSSRLFQEVREKRGLTYSVYSFSSSSAKGGLFGVYAGTGENEANETLEVICDELKKIQDHVSEEELQRAKAQFKAGILMSLESPTIRCEQNAGHLLIFNRLIEKEELIEKINKVSLEDIYLLSKNMFSQKITLALLGPVSKTTSYEQIEQRLI